MKFGKTLLRNQIPEWSKNYLSYKSLKKTINEAARNSPPSEEATTAIFFQLDRELEKVDTFYTYKQSQIDRRLWILSEKYHQYNNEKSVKTNGDVTSTAANGGGDNNNSSSTTSSLPDIQEELVSALQETRAQMSKIMWFAELNAKGFRKILKKLDKKLGLDTQNVYWQTKVAVLPFASHEHIRTEIDKVNNWISTLAVTDDRSLMRESTIRHPASVSVKLPMPDTIRRYNNLLTDQENEQCADAIDADDSERLALLLSRSNSLSTVKSKSDADQARYTLLELAVQRDSVRCIEYLVENGASPLDHHDINERNLLHKLCILCGEARPEQGSSKVLESLLQLLPKLPVQTDFAGRRPLHYAAEFGQSETVRLLMDHAVKHGYYSDAGFADPVWQDREGHTPLFLAILHGNYQTLSALIEFGNIKDVDRVIAAASQRQANVSNGVTSDNEQIPEFARLSHHPSVVAMACAQSNLDLLNLLIDNGVQVDLADEDGETALHIAIRTHFTDGVRALISRGHANVNLPEKINAWTPLIIAAMEGCQDIVELLLEAKADKSYIDNGGWAAYEHAVFRGHPEIGRLTKPDIDVEKYKFPAPAASGQSNGSQSPTTKARSRAGRLYGHKYLTDQCMIIIKLGSNDVRNPLSQRFLKLDDSTLDEQRLSISVSAINATGELPILDLPPNNQQQLLQPEPMVLFATKPEDVVLRFDLLETFGSPRADKIIARGTATLATDLIYTKSRGFKGRAPGNSSLRGQQSVPLVQASTLDYIGSLGFEYFVVTPFFHPKMTVGDRYTYYKSLDTKIIGHRGSGMNQRAPHLQVGENTVLSFITAASLGAEYVEFDVQLTKDLVPVIYHDWTVTETGFDIPLNAITSEQFLNLRPSGHIKEYHTGVSDGTHGEIQPTFNGAAAAAAATTPSYDIPAVETTGNALKVPSPPNKRVNRSNSLSAIGGSTMHGRTVASNRLEFTRTNKLGKLKGNGPETIQAPFTTLAEALKLIPKTAGCNIEVKYPMIDEAESDELHQFQEINIFVDTILECVYDHAEQDRRIIFSSFHPEICVALNLKQPNYPVFFLTDAGTLPMADVRCNSLQGAVRFAKQADLLGIVAASEPILEAPRMTTIIKESGLLLFTYGVLNNEVEHAVAQKNYGVDAVIVDSVVAVRKGLRGDSQASAS
ncbi:Glycerophosphoryl diester phosphodiesterase family-domain-containing protein [Zychaea mexicana]|uniref:Glycerophosphoryl diester phosphodiesterase family-domain-containing protein n=1 Tax=Zychaea mexicana TaxID=64656 RepID=UPI0022FDB352|nr:Glycerophosphoryl diester phosphodiesterase family-domain-containing protein [Zychaea mexicana]KAI9498524.1 Glycerophosphoryl diester phosphodiesterase family-domain-containing protein [Zychaea mexicana]